MKQRTKIIHLVILGLIAIALFCFNYFFYRFAYQASILQAVIIICAVMQLFVKAKKNYLYLYIVASICVCFFFFFLPKYSVDSAKKAILKEDSSITNIHFWGKIDEVSEVKKLLPTQEYVFEINNLDNKKIIFNPGTGHFSMVNW